MISYLKLGQAIRQVFVESDKYQMHKYVPEFTANGAYVGDCFDFTMAELRGEEAPVFYHVFSPFDIISKKAPQQALVFESGKLVLNVDFSEYVRDRTAVMSPLVFTAMGARDIAGRILFVGTGKVARAALRALKEYYPGVGQVEFVNTRGHDQEFVAAAKELNVEATLGDVADIGRYDFIICHTNAKEPILTADLKQHVKRGAIIASFVTEGGSELADEFFDTEAATIVVDWDKTLEESLDVRRSIDSGLADAKKIIRLKDLFEGTASVGSDKHYTVFRFRGTPMQNLAVLKLLVEEPVV